MILGAGFGSYSYHSLTERGLISDFISLSSNASIMDSTASFVMILFLSTRPYVWDITSIGWTAFLSKTDIAIIYYLNRTYIAIINCLAT